MTQPEISSALAPDIAEEQHAPRGGKIIDRACMVVGSAVVAGAVICAGAAGIELIKAGFAQAEAARAHEDWTAADLDDKKDKLAWVTTGFGGAGILGAGVVGWTLCRPEELSVEMPATAVPELS